MSPGRGWVLVGRGAVGGQAKASTDHSIACIFSSGTAPAGNAPTASDPTTISYLLLTDCRNSSGRVGQEVGQFANPLSGPVQAHPGWLPASTDVRSGATASTDRCWINGYTGRSAHKF